MADGTSPAWTPPQISGPQEDVITLGVLATGFFAVYSGSAADSAAKAVVASAALTMEQIGPAGLKAAMDRLAHVVGLPTAPDEVLQWGGLS